MEQSSVEWLVEQIETLIKNGYVFNPKFEEDFIEQAKEFENEILFKCWKASEQNMRNQFSSSNYKNITFDEWYKEFKNK